MMQTQIQSVFDTVCRCFGHVVTQGEGEAGMGHHRGQSGADNASQASAKRRAARLELKDKRWDDVFEKKNQKGSRRPNSSNRSSRRSSDNDLGVAHAVAQAKLAANPPKYRPKRKRSGKSKDDIFRSKDNPSIHPHRPQQESSTFSRLLNPSIALCFATPIRGTEEEQEEADIKSVDNSDTATLNTCEDTITSTVYFENKYSHLVETRPPMPLFNQFKLKHEKDEIRNIIATDSHSSLNMIQLLQQQRRDAQREPVQLEESSSDEDHARRRRKQERRATESPDQEMEDVVPDVKAVSSSTDSSRQSNAAVQSQSS